MYYNNSNWQVLSEYDGSNNFQRNYVYGNYIDEVLMMTDSGSNDYYYAHDHLFSPAALIDDNGTVVERYEYDAYGDCNVLDADYSKDADGISDYGNPYLFTGRRLDILDTASLKIMYYRNRYYDTETGRLLTHDPMDYVDGMNLYEYVKSNPVIGLDPQGLFSSIGDPGMSNDDVDNLTNTLEDSFIASSLQRICDRYDFCSCCEATGIRNYNRNQCYAEARALGLEYASRMRDWINQRRGQYNYCYDYSNATMGFNLTGGRWLRLRQATDSINYRGHSYVGVFHSCNNTDHSDMNLDPWSFGDWHRTPRCTPGTGGDIWD